MFTKTNVKVSPQLIYDSIANICSADRRIQCKRTAALSVLVSAQDLMELYEVAEQTSEQKRDREKQFAD